MNLKEALGEVRNKILEDPKENEKEEETTTSVDKYDILLIFIIVYTLVVWIFVLMSY